MQGTSPVEGKRVRARLGAATVLLRSIEKRAPAAGGTRFWSLWLAHRETLRRYSLKLSGGNAAEAEDALSEAMLKGAQAFPRLTIRHAQAWLLRLVHNAAIDRHRAHRRSDRAAETLGAATIAAAAEPSPTPEELLASRQAIEAIERALAALPGSLAEPLALHLDEEGDAAIAARLGISRDVVRKRRQMARQFLRGRLAEPALLPNRA